MKIKENFKEIMKELREKGFVQAFRLGKIKYSRHIGHKEIQKMPRVEKFLEPLIRQFQGIKTEITPINKEEENIFICWWDGVEKAPRVVRYCFENTKKLYGDKYQIHFIDKYNFARFVALDDLILKRYDERKISIQTLTDILRVKLLLEHGGYWVDSTILLDANFPFFEQLHQNSFDSFYATTPADKSFIEYKGKIEPCLSYFLGGRKGCIIYAFIYESFLKWLKEKKSLPPYFLLDMILTLTMVYDLDNGAVNKITHHIHDIGFVQKNENKPYNEVDISKMKCPQKLNWRSTGNRGSFLDALLSDFYLK